jgi:hypothetical protein
LSTLFPRNLPCLQQQLEVEGHAEKLGEALAVRQEAEAVAAQRRALLPAPPSDTSRSLLPPPALLAFAPRFTQSSNLDYSELLLLFRLLAFAPSVSAAMRTLLAHHPIPLVYNII